tara:strand:- start:228 stop:380 length:153 start_codon:yes stop_codon:yes gene_type:complete
MTRRMRLERAFEIVKGILLRDNYDFNEWLSLVQVKSDIKFVLKELEKGEK